MKAARNCLNQGGLQKVWFLEPFSSKKLKKSLWRKSRATFFAFGKNWILFEHQKILGTIVAFFAKEVLGMSNQTYGYVRVSTKNQNEERQLIALTNFGIPLENIVVEKQSGKDFKRPLYQRLVDRLQAGDVLVVESLDRLGRNYEETLAQWKHLTKDLNVDIVVLDMPILDTRKGDQRQNLTATLITDLVIQLLSYVAQTEREQIRQRQAEGIAAAKQRGVHCGRARMSLPDGFEERAEEWWNGVLPATRAAKELGISPQTFTRRATEWGKAHGYVEPAAAARS